MAAYFDRTTRTAARVTRWDRRWRSKWKRLAAACSSGVASVR
jgi:hypothetical protein